MQQEESSQRGSDEEMNMVSASIEKLQDYNVNAADINKLKNAGICTVKGLLMATKKELTNIKGISDQKIDKMIGDSPIIAHNKGFEKSCIEACADEFGTNDDYEYIDTLKLSREYLDTPNHKLDTICEALDVKLKHHHNALDDAIAAGECFIKMKNDYLKNE